MLSNLLITREKPAGKNRAYTYKPGGGVNYGCTRSAVNRLFSVLASIGRALELWHAPLALEFAPLRRERRAARKLRCLNFPGARLLHNTSVCVNIFIAVCNEILIDVLKIWITLRIHDSLKMLVARGSVNSEFIVINNYE